MMLPTTLYLHFHIAHGYFHPRIAHRLGLFVFCATNNLPMVWNHIVTREVPYCLVAIPFCLQLFVSRWCGHQGNIVKLLSNDMHLSIDFLFKLGNIASLWNKYFKFCIYMFLIGYRFCIYTRSTHTKVCGLIQNGVEVFSHPHHKCRIM